MSAPPKESLSEYIERLLPDRPAKKSKPKRYNELRESRKVHAKRA
jgi:hypothetical protein